TATVLVGTRGEAIASEFASPVSAWPMPTGRHGAAICRDRIRRRKSGTNYSLPAAHAGGGGRHASAAAGCAGLHPQQTFRTWPHQANKHSGSRRSDKTFERRTLWSRGGE